MTIFVTTSHNSKETVVDSLLSFLDRCPFWEFCVSILTQIDFQSSSLWPSGYVYYPTLCSSCLLHSKWTHSFPCQVISELLLQRLAASFWRIVSSIYDVHRSAWRLLNHRSDGERRWTPVANITWWCANTTIQCFSILIASPGKSGSAKHVKL